MAQASHLSRYRPAVLAVTGIAAACGIYLLYSTYVDSPGKTALRRSNAVHRPRGDRSRIQMNHVPSSPEAPLGIIVLVRGNRALDINLATAPFPTVEEINNQIGGSITGDSYHEAVSLGLDIVLNGCLRARTPHERDQLIRYLHLPADLASRDEDFTRQYDSVLAVCFPGVSDDIIREAIETFIKGDIHADAGASDSDADFAETEDMEGFDGASREPSQGIKGLLYYIAEDDARRKAYEHRGIHCEECGETPIRGVRWHCLNCPDFDLCSTCEPRAVHPKTHVFAKIKIPLSVLSQPTKAYPLWYPGDPRKLHSPLDVGVKKRISQQYGFDETTIDAFYDQFTCIANVPWSADPTKVQAAIDRRAFGKALTSERWPQRFAPNAMYDRIFAFYDEDSDGRIGFEAYVSGLAYLRGPSRFASLRRALQGFDIDGDGLVERTDFVRLFRAKYVIQQQLVNDIVEGHEAEQTMAAMDVMRSSQPISSVFNQEEIPQGVGRPRGGKQLDAFGEMRPLPGTKTILDDDDPWPRERSQSAPTRRRVSRSAPSHEHWRNQLSRIEEMLHATTNYAAVPQHDNESSTARTSTGSVVPESPRTSSDHHHASNRSETDDREEPLNADVLLQIVEDGFNDMLDPMFKAVEARHQEAIETRDERLRWRPEIERALEEKRAFQEELESAALVDPLMATAMKSYHTIKVYKEQVQQPTQRASEPAFQGEIVPTDAESLARREEEISQRPLEDLLDATGYSTIDSTEQRDAGDSGSQQAPGHSADGDPTTALDESRQAITNNTFVASDGISSDPTLPQNRPNAVPTLAASHVEGAPSQSGGDTMQSEPAGASSASGTPPSRQHLEYLASLDDIEMEIDDRGGPGRLRLEEIEGMARADTTKKLRGLVTCWLEWAAF